MNLLDTLCKLPIAHREALMWFHEQRGQEVGWPGALHKGMLLVSKAKGIYKPAGFLHALSVRESLNGLYPDREPTYSDSGIWTYPYYQEKIEPNHRDAVYTNRALLACIRDQVPVGVIRQVKRKPEPRYKVLGLALVRGWENGYFLLEGTGENTDAHAKL